ncbi:MAG: DnaJ domain-containing protein [Cyanobacteriota bacterium]|nr:DnaJ domain-containing protein [Cyanobacteriota bacterium]
MTSQGSTHYHTLGIPTSASPAEIKQAYRRLVKQHHPDATQNDGDRIRQINAAYAILRDREARHSYDQHIQPTSGASSYSQAVTTATVSDEATAQQEWIQKVYAPLNRLLAGLLKSLNPELNSLSADPFDPDLVDDFDRYLQDCREKLSKAQILFRGWPNPSSLAGVATRFYYILNHLDDALEELAFFPLNFDDRHLHTGLELFRRAQSLRHEAMEALRAVQISG